jgi:hypothetical protein
MSGKYVRFGMLILAVCLAAGLLAAIPGCFGGEPGVDEIWKKSQGADSRITSQHMDIAIYYQNTKYGSGQIQTMSIDASGNNIHAQNVLFGQSFSEVIRVGDKQYSRLMGSDKWTGEPASISIQTVTGQTEGFSNLPTTSTSQENLGVEMVNGVEAYHLSFALAPENVSSLFTNVSASQLSANAGGNVDVWVDKKDFYKLKYEALIRNALITNEIGYGDIRIVTSITEINKPISITPPV